MKIIVTGGAGFIGSHLVDKLIEGDNDVAIIDNLSTGKIENLNQKAAFYNVDICDSRVKAIFEKEKPEIIFHLAAQINVRESVNDPVADAQTNILGSLNIFENARICGTKKIIFISTGGAIYGEAAIIPTPENYLELPLSPYGVAKLAVEKYLHYYSKVFNINYAILRLANVYGPRQNSNGEAGVIAIFCDKILSGNMPVIYGSGEQTRDFVYVEDIVSAALAAIAFPNNSIYNIGTGLETDINQIFSKLKRLADFVGQVDRKSAKSGEQMRSCLDCSKAISELKWHPRYDLDSGLSKTIEWFKSKNNNL
jgi:UDP-glucose 4-epimerase